MPTDRNCVIGPQRNSIQLTRSEWSELNRQAAGLRNLSERSQSSDGSRRARLLLLLAEGNKWTDVCDQMRCSPSFVNTWLKRFREERLACLYERQRHEPFKPDAKKNDESRILEATKRAPPDGAARWSTRKLAAYLSVSHMMVARVWAKHGIKPHLRERQIGNKDANVGTKFVDIVGLYMNGPAHAAVFSEAEIPASKSAEGTDSFALATTGGVRATDRTERTRGGLLSLGAAFHAHATESTNKVADPHTTRQLFALLSVIKNDTPSDTQIHVIVDALSIDESECVRRFLAKHRNVHLHFAATYTLWLDQVESWLAKAERSALLTGLGGNVKGLHRKLRDYIHRYNNARIAVKWGHGDSSPHVCFKLNFEHAELVKSSRRIGRLEASDTLFADPYY